MQKITVDLAERSYPIYIGSGILQDIARCLPEEKFTEEIFIITDDHVRALYGEDILRAFSGLSRTPSIISVPPGEQSKSLDVLNDIYTSLIRRAATRKSAVVAFGGGVVGDLAGFVAATFMRGVPFVQIPTTVLAQVDSSVGGKVGVNHRLGKNLVGAFYQPLLVYIDLSLLKTLPQRELFAGFAEVVKYGLIRDARFFDFVADHFDAAIDLQDLTALEKIIKRCCEIKADVVSRDEKESGLRAVLNFGHTIGHALEASTDYGYFLHGEAIVHGMRAALCISENLVFRNKDQLLKIRKLLDKFHSPPVPDGVTPTDIMQAMSKDKKRTKDGQLWVLLEGIGEAIFTRDVPKKVIMESIEFIIRS
ncbi:3-dehydroquinate synthase [candidate division KSB1 bacterium RBG_16_48_16]|nr:MAG: 3-dehydroquinate synthase [candidate division KSB1 bacterium RBG_16_48_16]